MKYVGRLLITWIPDDKTDEPYMRSIAINANQLDAINEYADICGWAFDLLSDGIDRRLEDSNVDEDDEDEDEEEEETVIAPRPTPIEFEYVIELPRPTGTNDPSPW